MRYRKFTIPGLLLAGLAAVLIVASFVERQVVIGQSTTCSPDGNWCLDLKLVEHSALFRSRKMLHAKFQHRKEQLWRVLMISPQDDADGKTIGNQDQNHPVTWSDDSSTVTYWINKQRRDSMKTETNGGQVEFHRDLDSFSAAFDQHGVRISGAIFPPGGG